MLDTGARYVYEVYRLKSVSKAAERLFISQPALSAAVRRVEEELGTPIFNRKTLPFSLTPEGKVYIEAVEKMLLLEKQAAEHIQDIRETKQGLLRIGTSTHLSYFILPIVLRDFHKQYPQVDVHITSTPTTNLYHLLENDSVDLVFSPTTTVPEHCVAVPLLEERLVVALRRDTPEAAPLLPWAVSYRELVERSYGDDRILTDLSLLAGLEFMYSPTNTDIYKKRRLLFNGTDPETYVLSNTPSTVFNYNLMRAGVGAFITADANVATMPPNDDCVYLVLGGNGARQDFSLVYPTAAVSTVRDAFIATATRHFSPDYSLADLRTV